MLSGEVNPAYLANDVVPVQHPGSHSNHPSLVAYVFLKAFESEKVMRETIDASCTLGRAAVEAVGLFGQISNFSLDLLVRY